MSPARPGEGRDDRSGVVFTVGWRGAAGVFGLFGGHPWKWAGGGSGGDLKLTCTAARPRLLGGALDTMIRCCERRAAEGDDNKRIGKGEWVCHNRCQTRQSKQSMSSLLLLLFLPWAGGGRCCPDEDGTVWRRRYGGWHRAIDRSAQVRSLAPTQAHVCGAPKAINMQRVMHSSPGMG